MWELVSCLCERKDTFKCKIHTSGWGENACHLNTELNHVLYVHLFLSFDPLSFLLGKKVWELGCHCEALFVCKLLNLSVGFKSLAPCAILGPELLFNRYLIRHTIMIPSFHNIPLRPFIPTVLHPLVPTCYLISSLISLQILAWVGSNSERVRDWVLC